MKPKGQVKKKMQKKDAMQCIKTTLRLYALNSGMKTLNTEAQIKQGWGKLAWVKSY